MGTTADDAYEAHIGTPGLHGLLASQHETVAITTGAGAGAKRPRGDAAVPAGQRGSEGAHGETTDVLVQQSICGATMTGAAGAAAHMTTPTLQGAWRQQLGAGATGAAGCVGAAVATGSGGGGGGGTSAVAAGGGGTSAVAAGAAGASVAAGAAGAAGASGTAAAATMSKPRSTRARISTRALFFSLCALCAPLSLVVLGQTRA